jgi:hypothetical protein
VTGVAPTVVAEESSRGDKAIATETTVVTAVSAEAVQGGSLSADEQMVSELLGEQGGSFSDLPFIIVSSLPPSSSSSMQAEDAPSQAHATRDEEILAEINAEIEAAGHSGTVSGSTAAQSPAPATVAPSGGTVSTSVTDPVPPTPPAGSLHVDSSSEEDIDIMPPAEEPPPERRHSKRRISIPSDTDDVPLVRRKKKK